MSRLLEYFNHKFPYSDFHELNADWLISAYKELIAEVDKLDSWKAQHEEEYEELAQIVNDLNEGKFSDDFINALISWYKDNIIDIIGEMVKQVYFGLTDSGYFVAYIPESWNDIIFGTTGLDDFPSGVDYGHLTLSY